MALPRHPIAMMRALYHFAALRYYEWALRHIDLAHPDATEPIVRAALHRHQLDTFLRPTLRGPSC